jgi:hypothetical protein
LEGQRPLFDKFDFESKHLVKLVGDDEETVNEGPDDNGQLNGDSADEQAEPSSTGSAG